MDLARLLMRMAMWARRPPSRRHLQVMIVVAAVTLFCVAFQHFFGWPDWLTAHRALRQPRL
ncbi:hypothetical protein [Ancylobacter oerskovii]|uniref:Uncharacterized protein n=1 Tax=Ancylobacter oerskovii TaxID=459519 RepID=A0ABW4Z0Y5_9HYPH|nr:hypothetical protein [Ancylobacter oerskovii]MBS7542541.1 hypothetical protein [Ancylobacter oerskovii]